MILRSEGYCFTSLARLKTSDPWHWVRPITILSYLALKACGSNFLRVRHFQYIFGTNMKQVQENPTNFIKPLPFFENTKRTFYKEWKWKKKRRWVQFYNGFKWWEIGKMFIPWNMNENIALYINSSRWMKKCFKTIDRISFNKKKDIMTNVFFR